MSLIVDLHPKKLYVPMTRSDQDHYLTAILNFPKAFKNFCGYVSESMNTFSWSVSLLPVNRNWAVNEILTQYIFVDLEETNRLVVFRVKGFFSDYKLLEKMV